MPMLAEMAAAPSLEQKRAAQLGIDFGGDIVDVGGIGDIGEDDGEFVAAQPGHRIGVAHAGLDALGSFLEQLIARPVTELVVDLLEVVQVDEKQAQPQPVAGGMPSSCCKRSRNRPRLARSVRLS